MSKIKKLLHKYLCKDAIIVCELSEKSNDFVWLEEQGFYDRKIGKETEKGKRYTKKHNELIQKHFSRIKDNSFSSNNLAKLRKELEQYLNNAKGVDKYKALSESELFAFRYVFNNHW